MKREKGITGWTIKVWWDNGKTECVDTTNLPDDVAQGVDDFLYRELESEKCRCGNPVEDGYLQCSDCLDIADAEKERIEGNGK